MVAVKTQDYKGPGRRKGLNGDGYVRLVMPVLIPIMISVMALGGYKWVIADTDCRARKNEEKITVIEKECTTFKTELPYIKDSVRKIEVAQQAQMSDIKQILHELSKMNRRGPND